MAMPRQAFREATIDLSRIGDPLLAWFAVRAPLAMAARKRQLEAMDPADLDKLYGYLGESLNREKVLLDRSITAGASATKVAGEESAAAQRLQGTYRSAAASENVTGMRVASAENIQRRDQAFKEKATEFVTNDERDQIQSKMMSARQAFEKTPGDYATKLANARAVLIANTADLVKGKDPKHADAIAYEIARSFETVVNPGDGAERATFQDAMADVWKSYGVVPVYDRETGQMVPRSILDATEAGLQTALAEKGQTVVIRGSGQAPTGMAGAPVQQPPPPAQAAPPSRPLTQPEVEAAATGTVDDSPEAARSLPAGAVAIRGSDGQRYMRFYTGEYALAPDALYAGDIGAVSSQEAKETEYRKLVNDEIARRKALADEARASGADPSKIALDMFDRGPHPLTAVAKSYGERLASMTPEERRAESARLTTFLNRSVPAGKLPAKTQKIDAEIEASRASMEDTENLGGASYGAAPLPAEHAATLLREQADTIKALNAAWAETSAGIKAAGLKEDDPAAKEARGRWYAAFMAATNALPGNVQEAVIGKVVVPPDVGAALATMVKARQAPDRATREMDAEEARRAAKAIDDTAAATAKALKGDAGADARTQGEADFEALAARGTQAFGDQVAELRREARVSGQPQRYQHLLGVEDAAERKGPEWGAMATVEKKGPPKYGALVTPNPAANQPGETHADIPLPGWEPKRDPPPLNARGLELSPEDLTSETHKDAARAEYDTKVGDDDAEARELYVGLDPADREAYVAWRVKKKAKKTEEPADAANP